MLVDFVEGEVEELELGICGEVSKVSKGSKIGQVQAGGSSTRAGSRLGVVIKPL